jgi:hypothetical protein
MALRDHLLVFDRLDVTLLDGAEDLGKGAQFFYRQPATKPVLIKPAFFNLPAIHALLPESLERGPFQRVYGLPLMPDFEV